MLEEKKRKETKGGHKDTDLHGLPLPQRGFFEIPKDKGSAMVQGNGVQQRAPLDLQKETIGSGVRAEATSVPLAAPSRLPGLGTNLAVERDRIEVEQRAALLQGILGGKKR